MQVNLVLERASEWLNIDGCKPLKGRVVLHSKTARVATGAYATVGGFETSQSNGQRKVAALLWLGRYAFFDSLTSRDQIEVTFPIAERKETYSLLGLEEDMWPEPTVLGEQWQPKIHRRNSRFICEATLSWISNHAQGSPDFPYINLMK